MEFGDDLVAFNQLLREADELAQERAGSQQSKVKCAPTVASNPAADAAAGRQVKGIWDSQEVPSRDAIELANDGRPAPVFDILYKQDVTSEDVFLGTGDKTPGSQDCTHMVVKVRFPGASLADLDLDVTRNTIKAESRNLRLATYLPLAVDESKGKAQWDAKQCTLSVTLPIIRAD